MEKEDIPRLRGDMATCPRLLAGSLDPLDHSSRPRWLMKLVSLKYCQLNVRTASGLREREGLPLESVTGAVLVNSADGRQWRPVGLVGLERPGGHDRLPT